MRDVDVTWASRALSSLQRVFMVKQAKCRGVLSETKPAALTLAGTATPSRMPDRSSGRIKPFAAEKTALGSLFIWILCGVIGFRRFSQCMKIYAFVPRSKTFRTGLGECSP